MAYRAELPNDRHSQDQNCKSRQILASEYFFDRHLQAILEIVGNFVRRRMLIYLLMLRQSMCQELKIQVCFCMGQSGRRFAVSITADVTYDSRR